MDCSLCKVGTTEKGWVTVTLERGKAIVLIKEVPAQVCSNCGHYYLSEEMTSTILKRGEDALKRGTELEVIKLNVA